MITRKIHTTLLLFICFLGMGQTPPARTYFLDDYGFETNHVKERWEENSFGERNGTYIKYGSNGVRIVLGNYKSGKKNGEWIFMKNNIVESINYQNNVVHGKYLKKTSSGVVISNGFYINGNKEGVWYEKPLKDVFTQGLLTFYNNSVYSKFSFFSSGKYKNGVRVGVWENLETTVNQEFEEGKILLFFGMSNPKYFPIINKGYKSYFSEEGDLIKCLDDKGEDVLLNSLFAKTNSITGCEVFLEQYPNSKYSYEVKVNLNRLKQEEQKRIIDIRVKIYLAKIVALRC